MPARSNAIQVQTPAPIHGESDGVEMGVLSDGTPYLTAQGLAKLCGVDPSPISQLVSGWATEKETLRGRKIAELVAEQGHDKPELHIDAEWRGERVLALSDAVCVAILLYYACEEGSEVARRALRLLGLQTLRQFIYKCTECNPESSLSSDWREYHDRLLLNRPPGGYFNLYNEATELVLATLRQGLEVDEHTVPDAHLGRAWDQSWVEGRLEERFGRRIHQELWYPDHHPLSRDGAVAAWAYPNAACGVFRRWLCTFYLPIKYPVYVSKMVEQGAVDDARAESLLTAARAHFEGWEPIALRSRGVHPGPRLACPQSGWKRGS